MPEPKIIEGKARRRPPLSKPLAVVYIVLGLGALVWAYFTRSDSPAHFFFVVGITAAISLIVAELMRNLD